MSTHIDFDSDQGRGVSPEVTFFWSILLAIFFGGILIALVFLIQFPSHPSSTVEEDPTLHPTMELSPNMETAPAIPGTTAPVTPDNPIGPEEG